MASSVREGLRLTDTTGMHHLLTKRLSGDTGFGEVWRTQEPRTLIKIFWAERDDDVAASELLTRLRLLPLDGLSVVRPTNALRRPRNGYVMRGVFGGDTWLDFETKIGSRPTDSWVQAQVRLTEVLSTLHARSLVFGDLNPKNVLIAPDGSDVALIDLDTVVREGAEFDQRYLAARWRKYTPPGFSGRDAYTFDDLWMFATVLVDSWNEQRRPAIEDILPDAQQKILALKSAPGRDMPGLPSASQLWQCLARDADAVLRCVRCNVITQDTSCPDCGRQLWNATLKIGRQVTIRCTSGVWRTMHRRHVQTGPETGPDHPVARVLAEADGVSVEIDGHRRQVPFGVSTILETPNGAIPLRPERASES